MGSTWNDARPLVRALDPHDDDLFRAWYAIMRAGAPAGRESPSLVTYEALSTSLRMPNPRKKRTAYGAFVGDTLVGTAMVDLQTQENPHLAEIEINVPPDRRRRGFGTSLLDHVHRVAAENGRTTFLTEINVPARLVVAEWPGSAFATRNGFISAHQEDHLVLDLPVDPARFKTLTRAAAAHRRAYDLVTWIGSCPEELVDAYAVLNTVMGQDVPTGQLDHLPPAWDGDRVRLNDERMAAQGYTSITTVARQRGARFAGYSLMFVDVHNPTAVSQDDTFVMSAHRGHRLGVALKLANLAIVARDYPDRQVVHTWTAGVNGQMQGINEMFGFRKVEKMHEYQRVDKIRQSAAPGD